MKGKSTVPSWKVSTYALVTIGLALCPSAGARAADPAVERGKYLVTIGGCSDCHTPGYFLGKPDLSRRLGGSDVGFELPGLGVFYGPNLTMDNDTGLGRWTNKQIATALTTGIRPDGRRLAPIMPWQAFAALTEPDTRAIVSYLRALPTVRHQVPGPFGPLEPPTSYVMRLVPPTTSNVSAEVGGALAERWCTSCHVVERAPRAEAAGAAPSFREIAARPSTTMASLDRHLSSAHTGMPDFALTRFERSLLIAYILSLHT